MHRRLQLFALPRMQRWMYYTLAIGLLPFVISVFMLSSKLTFGQFLRRPELPFFVIVVNAATIRDVTSLTGSPLRPWMTGSATVLMLAGAVMYILGRLPEVGVTVALSLTEIATFATTLLSILAAGRVQQVLAEMEREP